MKSLLDVIGVSESIVVRFMFAFQLQMTGITELNYYTGRSKDHHKILQQWSCDLFAVYSSMY